MGRKSSSSSSSEDSSSDSSSSSSSHSSNDLGRKKRTGKNPKNIKQRDDPWQPSQSSTARAATSVNQDYVDIRSCIARVASDHSDLSSLHKSKKSLSANKESLDRLICTSSSREHTTSLMENMQDVTSAEYVSEQELKPAVPENGEETGRGEGGFTDKKTEEHDAACTDHQISEVESINSRNAASSTEERLSLKGNQLAGKERKQMVGESALQTIEHREQNGNYESIAVASKDNSSSLEELSRSQTSNATGNLKFDEEEGESPQEGIKERSLLLDTSTNITVMKDSEDAGTAKHSSQLPVEDNTSRDDVNNNVQDESNLVRFEGSKSMKPKSERSAIHDKVKGIWICRHCGWQYPNPHPSAKVRRDHRRLCGKIQNVNTWLGSEEYDDQADSEDDTAVFKDKKYSNDIELRSESVQSDGDEKITPTTPEALEADQFSAESNVSDKIETTKVDAGGNVVTLSDETVPSGGDAESLILRETDSNAFAQDSTVKRHEALTHSSAPKSLETSLKDGNESVKTKETTEDSVRKWRPVEIGILSVTNFPSTETIFIDSSVRNGGHTLNIKESPNNDDSTMEIRTKFEFQETVSRGFGGKHANDISPNPIVIKRPNDPYVEYIYSEDRSDGLLSHAKGKLKELGTTVEGELHSLTLYPEVHHKRDSLEASTSKQKIEYVDLKDPSSNLDIMGLERLSGDSEYVDHVRVRNHISTKEVVSSTTEVVVDVEKVVKEQKTHDLLCPVCGSCITKRVILRKRKRTSIASLEKWHQERIEDNSPDAVSAGATHASFSETFWEQRTDLIEHGEDEDWGCLACLTIFFRRVRGVRWANTDRSSVMNRAGAAHIGAESDSDQNAPGEKVELVEEASKDHVSCMPYLFPAFPWGPGQSTSETELLKPLLSRELGDSANVDREVTIQEIVPSTSLSEDLNIRVTSLVNNSDTKDYVNCSSCLPWSHTDTKFSSVLGGEHTKLSIQKEDQGCLAFVFPEYPWGIKEYSESLAADGANQDDPVSISVKTELQTDQNEIISTDRAEVQAEIGPVVPCTPEIEEAAREVKDERLHSCLSLAFPEFPWGAGKTPDSGIIAEASAQLEENAAIQVEIVQENKGNAEELNSEHLSEDNGCFSFVLPDFRRETKKSLQMFDSSKQQEEASATVHELRAEKPLDIISTIYEERTYSETKQQKSVDIVVTEPIISNIETLEAATQKKDLTQIFPEKHSNAFYGVEEPSYKGKEIVQEIGAELQYPEIEDGCVDSIDTHQDLPVRENLGPAQEEIDCLSFAFPQFPWGPAVDNEVLEQQNVNLQSEIAAIKIDEGPSEILESDLTAANIAFNDFSTETINCDCLTAVLPQFPWGSERDAVTFEPQDIPRVLTQETKEDNVHVDPRDSGEIVSRLEEARTPCLPLLFPKFPWEHGTIIEQEEVNETPPTQSESNVATPVEHPEESTEERSLNCMPLLFPSYPWDQHSTQTLPEEEVNETPPTQSESNVATPVEHLEESTEERSLNCMPLLFPSYPWGQHSTQTLPEAIQEVASVKDVKEYVSQETRIQAKVTSTTNLVSVETTTTPTEQVVHIQSVQLDKSVTFVDESIKSNQPFDVLTIVNNEILEVRQAPSTATLTTRPSTGYAAIDFEDTLNKSLTTRPSTGYAVLEALEAQQINEETVPEATDEDQIHAIEDDHQADQQRLCHCFPLPPPKISWTWPSIQNGHSDIEQPLIEEQQTAEDEPISVPTSAGSITIVTTNSVVEPRVLYERKTQEYLKSIVYGGLDVTLASLGVVSSAAGGEAKTITVFALGLANLIAGFIALLHNIVHLYHFNRPSFEENVGKSLWINGSLTMLSFLLFGSVAPVTYGFSFRSSNDRDYKFVATAIVALFCLILLGSGKARVRGQPYIATVASLIATGFVASTAGYFAGHYIQRWLQKIGFDGNEPAGAPTQAPPPFFLGEIGRDMQVSSKSSS
ncbi:hypothetical protein O6H91_10G014800 [Diphasiastrum complanatum]|uniref:Uncharacterized protein n=5 Tax=Diphasiastrum complanatum TaxID=34168 RepID=A0ACC2CEK8_DIPCM|nr:hypothetical protein O6H91_10G014800 [Diphasiastrum complanatum]KAJ7540437.1 hypothetical protein O6H91_10G014800 [Diphasiastrum complanatum]KAJ7540438.1 hypothetical protein O6H91_10G014800 [Diphasiastrum complanatum]